MSAPASPEETHDRIRAAWREVREFRRRLDEGKVGLDADPQPRLARELFEAWQDDPAEPGAAEAVQSAFMMWGNVGDVEVIERGLSALDVTADYWETPLHAAGRAHWRAGRLGAYVSLLSSFEDRLTHPRSRSALCSMLASHYVRSRDDDRAMRYLSAVIQLDADPFDVLRAEGEMHEIQSLRVGQVAPDFEAVTIDGESISLSSFRGMVVCLEFWSTTCAPCRRELPFLRQVRAAHSDAELAVIGVARDMDEARLREVIAEEKLAWPHIREPVTPRGGVPTLGPISMNYNAWAVPRTFLVGPDGVIAAKNPRGEDLVEAVAALVEGVPGRPEAS